MKRAKLNEDVAGLYFVGPGQSFFSSGCTLLDCVLGGDGWAENRIINVVGDKSTGKTLLAIEAMANYAIKYPYADIYYGEAEAAFDVPYAQAIGMPVDRVILPEGLFTVEDWYKDLLKVVQSGSRALYILDSLDALSDDDEQARSMGDATYGTSKAKRMSELFRRMVKKLHGTNVTVMIISQVRDKIGVTFGKSHTRSGGHALDFYASQVLWLAHIARLERTRSNVKRTYGVKVTASMEKSKVGMPFRKCSFPIHFAYGVEDVVAGVEWLLEVKRHKELFTSQKEAKAFASRVHRLGAKDYQDERENVSEAVRRVWREIEKSFLPPRSKYDND